MKKLILSGLLLGLTACGSTGTEASGDDVTPGPGTFCGSFQIPANGGLVCDTTTTPHTLRVDFGTGPGKVVEGNDPRFGQLNPNKGKFLGLFTPTTTQGNPVTLAAPGGLTTAAGINPGGGALVFNQATGRIGMRGANEICAAITNFPGKVAAVPSAHICSNRELMDNTRAGNIPEGATGWAFNYEASPINFYQTANDPAHNAMKLTCQNGTYNTADIAQGTYFVVGDFDSKAAAAAGMATEIEFLITDDVPGGAIGGAGCSTVRPYPCCE